MVVMTEPASRAQDNGTARAAGVRGEMHRRAAASEDDARVRCTSLVESIHEATITVQSVDWAAALGQHERWLRTVVRARLGEGQAVDEVMQEVALAAIEHRAPIADSSKVAPWLYRIAVVRA